MDTRHKILAFLSAAAALLIGFRLVMLAGPGGNALRSEALQISESSGEISAIRGRIFDESGHLLVWSVRHYDLALKGKKEPETEPLALARKTLISQELLRTLKITYPAEDMTEHGVLKYDLTMRELELADELCHRFPELEVRLAWERCYAEDADRELLGAVLQKDGQENGVSGIELEFDAQLSGIPGQYQVMLDSHGNWIDSTFRLLREPQAGGDLYLEKDDAEIREPLKTEHAQ